MSEYVTQYRRLMLQLPQMHEGDRLHGFLYGLKHWVKRDLEKQSPTTWEIAAALAEKLYDTVAVSDTQGSYGRGFVPQQSGFGRGNQTGFGRGGGNFNDNRGQGSTYNAGYNRNNSSIGGPRSSYASNQSQDIRNQNTPRPPPWCQSCRYNH